MNQEMNHQENQDPFIAETPDQAAECEAESCENNAPLPPKPRNPDDWITEHFAWSEFLHSDTAVKMGLNNQPNTTEKQNIKMTAQWLEKLRGCLCDEYGREIGIRISSGFRSAKVNAAVGGAKNSAHRLGLAADIHASGLSAKKLAFHIQQFIKSGKLDKLDQLILETPRGGGTWVHIGLSAGSKRGDKLVYRWVSHYNRNMYVAVTDFDDPDLA